jgi:hypothetical protein
MVCVSLALKMTIAVFPRRKDAIKINAFAFNVKILQILQIVSTTQDVCLIEAR